MVYTNGTIFSTLYIPRLKENPSQKSFLSLPEAWEIVKNELSEHRRFKLKGIGLGQNDITGEFRWVFSYRKKTISVLFNRRKRVMDFRKLVLNAHTGEIISTE